MFAKIPAKTPAKQRSSLGGLAVDPLETNCVVKIDLGLHPVLGMGAMVSTLVMKCGGGALDTLWQ